MIQKIENSLTVNDNETVGDLYNKQLTKWWSGENYTEILHLGEYSKFKK